MLWKHVKWDKRLWEIPSTKTEIAHQIPLSDAALAILQEMKAHGTNDNEPVFPGMNNGESNMTIAKVIKQMNRGGPFWTDPKQDNRPVVPHGFRSSFSDFCGDRTNFDRQHIEFALAHGITDKTEAAYRRTTALEKRRRLMSQWAQYCAKPISNTVISFHRV